MQNYYEILEISEKASPEVIERVYKLLAKKYHPDLNPENPKAAEERFKKISEAYDVLSNETKRKEYDAQLRAERVMKEQEANAKRAQTTQPTEYVDDDDLYDDDTYSKERDYNMNKAYNDAYTDIMNKMGIKFVQKKSPKERILQLKSLGLTLLTFSILIGIIWAIPFTRNKLIAFYENNAPLKAIVDIFFGGNKDEEPDANSFIGVKGK